MSDFRERRTPRVGHHPPRRNRRTTPFAARKRRSA
jgi:hypothetical protein